MMGRHKGYDIHKVTKRMLQMESFGKDLVSGAEADLLCQECLRAIRDNGRVYCFTKGFGKKKEMACCAILTREEKSQNGVEEPILRMNKMYVCAAEKHLEPEFKKTILAASQDDLVMGNAKTVICDEQMLVAQGEKMGAKGYLIGTMIGVALAAVYGVLFKNVGVGMCFGVSFAMLWGTVFAQSGIKAKQVPVYKEENNAAD